MRVAYAFPVGHVERLANGALVAVGIEAGGAFVPAFPARIAVSLVVCLAANPVDATPGKVHPLTVRVLDPNLQDAAPPLSVAVGFTPGPLVPAGWEIRSTNPVHVKFEAKQPGAYSVEFDFGGAYSVPFAVRLDGPAPSP